MDDDDATGRAIALLGRCRKAAAAYGRPDLADRVGLVQERIADDALRVMLVGEFKHGKSSLLNSLLGTPVTPVDADIATSVPVVVRHGDPRAVEAVIDAEAGAAARVPVPFEELEAWVTEGGNPGNRRQVRRVEVLLPHPVLAARLAFVDTPGVGGLASIHGTITAAALPMADAALFVSDAAQELSANELEFLRTVVRVCPTVAKVTTKIDLHHHWRRVVELDAGHLDRAGIDLPDFPVSAALRDLADATGDETLVEDSGFGPLLRWLAGSVAKVGRRRTVASAVAEVHEVAGQLAARFEAERAALLAVDPATLLDDLARQKQRADALKGGASRWGSVLTDGFGDLQSDIDHDLRHRVRELNRKVDEMIDGFDPADAWPEFEPVLQRDTAAVVTENYAMLVERIEELVASVSGVFGGELDGAEFVARLSAADEVVAAAGGDTGVGGRKATALSQGMSILKTGQLGLGMFSTYAGLAGVALANPVSAVVALAMGGKGLKDEREKQLEQRRAKAKAAARRYVDEVNFVVGKDSRDTMRHLQRDLREFFTARAEEASRSAAEALAAAQAAVHRATDERAARVADLDAELGRLTKLRASADDLAGSAA